MEHVLRRIPKLIFAVAILSLVAAAAALAAQHHAGSTKAKLKSNRQAAHADAVHLIKKIKLPSGTDQTKKVTEGRGAKIQAVSTSYHASASYLAPADVNAYRYVLNHRPPHTTIGEGSSYRLKNGKRTDVSHSLYISFRDRPGVVFAREVYANFHKLKDGRSQISLTSQSSWIIPRPSSEKVPGSASRVLISGATRTRHGKSSWTHPAFTQPKKVKELVRLVDRPGITQDGTVNCPEEPGPYPLHRIKLRFQNSSGKTLVTVTTAWSGKAGIGSSGTACNPLTFALGKRSEPDLQDERFLVQLRKATGINPDR